MNDLTIKKIFYKENKTSKFRHVSFPTVRKHEYTFITISFFNFPLI